MEGKEVRVKPFLKWAGGKGQLLPQLQQFIPKEFNNYYEPFVGGGAVHFSLSHDGKSHINDINTALVSGYENIRDNIDEIIAQLKMLEEEYHQLDEEHRKELFYALREEYNKTGYSVRKTVLLIFLNRTCFNGLYRENRKGEFNVPFGKYKNPKICNEDNLRAISSSLKNTVITNTHYKDAVKSARKGDFVYFDPPYHPINETSSFTDYHAAGFTKKDQEHLRDLFKELKERGCFVMLSNSSTDFIKELYKDFRQEIVFAGRNINSQGAKRNKIKETLVLSY